MVKAKEMFVRFVSCERNVCRVECNFSLLLTIEVSVDSRWRGRRGGGWEEVSALGESTMRPHPKCACKALAPSTGAAGPQSGCSTSLGCPTPLAPLSTSSDTPAQHPTAIVEHIISCFTPVVISSWTCNEHHVFVQLERSAATWEC